MSHGTTRTRIVLLHWLALLLVLGSLISGLRLYSGNRLAGEPSWASWLPTGNVYALHLTLASLWAVLAVAYALHFYLARRSRQQSAQVQALPRGERANHVLMRIGRWLLSILLLSGAGVYFLGTASGDGWILPSHRYLAFALAAWVVLHGLMQLLGNQWPRVRAILFIQITPRALTQTALVLPLVAGTAFLVARAASDGATSMSLRVPSIALEESMTLDGTGDEAAWQRAPALEVVTAGIGENGVPVPVRVQALRQGAVIHFLFSWPDSTHSVQHLPLLKTAKGWIVEQQDLIRHDEQRYYEDKFAVMLAQHGDAAGDGAIHTGRAPLKGKPGSVTGRGYHAAREGELVDVWHWKSVRTPYELGQLDDSHFGSPYPVVPGEVRYTAGYKSDPANGGGYSENWTWFKEGVITPKRLPKDPALLEPFQKDWPAGEEPLWGMSWYETVPYSPERDTYPVGTRMPSVLWTSDLEDDRADVLARGRWQSGRWTLEIRRGLKAYSKFDLDIRDGTFLWVAPFDHAQTRHNYHLRPLRLHIEE